MAVQNQIKTNQGGLLSKGLKAKRQKVPASGKKVQWGYPLSYLGLLGYLR